MLQDFRNVIHSKPIKVLLIVVILSFVLWGVGDVLRSTYSGNIAEVENYGAITEIDLARQMRNEIGQYENVLGRQLTNEEIETMNIKRIALAKLINNKVLVAAAHKFGIEVNDSLALKYITKNPQFHNENGVFDKNRFKAIIANSNIAESDYINLLKQDIAVDLLVRATTYNVSLPDIIKSKVIDFYNQEKFVTSLYFPKNYNFPVTQASEDEIKEYYEQNKRMYLIPELRSFEYIKIVKQDVNKDINELELKQYYERNKSDYSKAESRNIINLLFTNEEDAQKSYEHLSAVGQDNIAMKAQEISGKELSEISLNDITKSNLPDEIKDQVFALNLNQISQPIESPMGWHVIYIGKINKDSYLEYEQVKSDIIKIINDKASDDKLSEVIEKISDDISEGKNLQEIAKEQNLAITKIDSISNNGRNKIGENLKLFGADPNLMTIIYSTDVGNISDVVKAKDGNFYVVTVKDIAPESYLSIDEVKKDITKFIVNNKRDQWLDEQVAVIKQEIDNGTSIMEIAKKMDVKAQKENFTIDDKFNMDDINNKNIWPNVVFLGVKGQVMNAVALKDGGHVIAVIDDLKIHENQDKDLPKKIDNMLYQSIFNELMQEMLTAAIKENPVKVFEQFEQLKAQ
jgi:peptidyl-prolyl cis-trans isomerase D